MTIEYSNDKDVKCFRAYVENPLNPKLARSFHKRFDEALAVEAIKLHQRLLECTDAAHYNRTYGQPKNCIEIKQGTKATNPKEFKVRVGQGPRKFFHQVKNEDGEFLLTKEWTGAFDTITHIYVIAVNNHDYNAV